MEASVLARCHSFNLRRVTEPESDKLKRAEQSAATKAAIETASRAASAAVVDPVDAAATVAPAAEPKDDGNSSCDSSSGEESESKDGEVGAKRDRRANKAKYKGHLQRGKRQRKP